MNSMRLILHHSTREYTEIAVMCLVFTLITDLGRAILCHWHYFTVFTLGWASQKEGN